MISLIIHYNWTNKGNFLCLLKVAVNYFHFLAALYFLHQPHEPLFYALDYFATFDDVFHHKIYKDHQKVQAQISQTKHVLRIIYKFYINFAFSNQFREIIPIISTLHIHITTCINRKLSCVFTILSKPVINQLSN